MGFDQSYLRINILFVYGILLFIPNGVLAYHDRGTPSSSLQAHTDESSLPSSQHPSLWASSDSFDLTQNGSRTKPNSSLSCLKESFEKSINSSDLRMQNDSRKKPTKPARRFSRKKSKTLSLSLSLPPVATPPTIPQSSSDSSLPLSHSSPSNSPRRFSPRSFFSKKKKNPLRQSLSLSDGSSPLIPCGDTATLPKSRQNHPHALSYYCSVEENHDLRSHWKEEDYLSTIQKLKDVFKQDLENYFRLGNRFKIKNFLVNSNRSAEGKEGIVISSWNQLRFLFNSFDDFLKDFDIHENRLLFYLENKNNFLVDISLYDLWLNTFMYNKKYKSITALFLPYYNISFFPIILNKFNLVKLDLSDNQIKVLPLSFSDNLKNNLQELNLSHNCIENIPYSIGELWNLRLLNLNNNKIRVLPDTICLLRRLNYLYVANNQLQYIPCNIGFLSSLQSLDIASNQITALPHSVQSLTQITSLTIKDNPLFYIPSLSPLKNLDYLDMTHIPAFKDQYMVFLTHTQVEQALKLIFRHGSDWLDPQIASKTLPKGKRKSTLKKSYSVSVLNLKI